MGTKRVSERTLPSGERVNHHPPDDAHPDGKMCLIKDGSALRDHLDSCLEDHQSRHADIQDAHTIRIQNKREAHAAKGLPPEKSPI